jgi:hypothetical protein
LDGSAFDKSILNNGVFTMLNYWILHWFNERNKIIVELGMKLQSSVLCIHGFIESWESMDLKLERTKNYIKHLWTGYTSEYLESWTCFFYWYSHLVSTTTRLVPQVLCSMYAWADVLSETGCCARKSIWIPGNR